MESEELKEGLDQRDVPGVPDSREPRSEKCTQTPNDRFNLVKLCPVAVLQVFVCESTRLCIFGTHDWAILAEKTCQSLLQPPGAQSVQYSLRWTEQQEDLQNHSCRS
jgi:hypothetical protein